MSFAARVLAALLALALLRCADDQSPGAEGASCYPNNTCNAGLTCYSGRCVRILDGGPVDTQPWPSPADLPDARPRPDLGPDLLAYPWGGCSKTSVAVMCAERCVLHGKVCSTRCGAAMWQFADDPLACRHPLDATVTSQDCEQEIPANTWYRCCCV